MDRSGSTMGGMYSSCFPHLEGRGSLRPHLADKGREEEDGHEVRHTQVLCVWGGLVRSGVGSFSAFHWRSRLFHLGFDDGEGVRSCSCLLYKIHGMDEVLLWQGSQRGDWDQLDQGRRKERARERSADDHMALYEGDHVVGSSSFRSGRQGHRSASKLERSRTNGFEVCSEKEGSFDQYGEEPGYRTQGRVDARSKRIWCRRPGRSGRARHDRVRSKEQHVSDQDFGCWCEVPYFSPRSEQHSDSLWQTWDRWLHIVWSGASRGCVQDLSCQKLRR